MDNCEHLVDAAAALVELMASRCPGVRVLATSREALALEGEEVVPVKPLDPGSSAVELFVERARAAGAAVGSDASDAIREICARLDGIPLAIELAAARARSMTPAEIAGVLDRRFAILGGARRRAPGRHQTLRQAVDWSYALLDPHHRELFDRLGVFAGTFDVAAVMTVAGVDELTARTGLDALVDRSLVEADPAGESTRYRLLETLRQYAHDRLADSGLLEETSRRHADHFAALAALVHDGIRSANEAAWVRRVDADLANFRAALTWAVSTGEADMALRLLAGLHDDAWHRQRYELLSWATDALSIDGALDHHLAPAVLTLASRLTSLSGDQAKAKALAERAIALEADLGLTPSFWPRSWRSACFWFLNRVDEAISLAHDAWAVENETRHDDYDQVWSVLLRGWLYHAHDAEASRRAADEALASARRLCVPTLLGWSLYLRGTLRRRSDPVGAAADLQEAMAVARAVKLTYVADGAELALVSALALSGNPDPTDTLSRFDRLLERQLHNGDLLRTATTLRQLALHLAESGHHGPAAVLRAAEAGFPSQPIPAVADPERHQAALRAAEQAIDRPTLDAWRTEGGGMSIADAARYARARIDTILNTLGSEDHERRGDPATSN